MFRLGFLYCSLAILLGFAAGAMGDTVTLKSGEKIEGKITAETDQEITLEIHVTASITDERKVKKSDVAKVDKVQPGEFEWGALKGLDLGEDSFELADYQSVMTRLDAFLKEFPASTHAAEAKAKLAKFTEEQKRVAKGEIKEKGAWLSPDEVKEERVQIGGRILLARMKRYAAAGQFPEAMNIFEALRKNFNGSAAMPDAIELARQIVPQIKTAAEAAKARLAAHVEDMNRRLEIATGNEHQQLAQMYRNEKAAADQAAAAAEKSGARWLPLNPPQERALNSLAALAANEANSLSNLPVDKMRISIQAAQDARKALEARNLEEAEKQISLAQSNWSANEMTRRLQPKVAQLRKDIADARLAAEKAKAEQAKAAEAEKNKPKPAPAPAASAPVASSANGGGDSGSSGSSDPFYTRPIVWVIVAVLGLFGVLGYVAYQKFRDPNRNLLDQ